MPCRDIITSSEVLRAHDVLDFGLSGSFVGSNDCQSHRRFDVIDLKDPLQESVLDREIAFEFLPNSQLFGSSGNGKVAKLGNIRIKEDKKVIGIGKAIHVQQLLVFGQNNFNEIQLKAKWDGVIAWPSLFFKFRNEHDEDELLEHIVTYMLDILGFDSSKVNGIMYRYSGIRHLSRYLKPTDKIWFTKWYQETNRTLQYEMYKEVS